MQAEEIEELERQGVTIPTDQVIRSANWVTLMSQTDRLTDLLARDWFESKLSLVPADASIATGDLAARLCRSLARSAVARARKHAAEWEALADGLTAAHRTTFADDWSAMWEREVTAGHAATSAQIMVASYDPMARVRWSDRLQARGTQLIQQIDGDKGLRPDVYDSNTHRYVARPDHVAHAAQVRFVNPQPCRYGRNGNQPASVTIRRRAWFGPDVEGDIACHERLTTLTDLTSERRAMLLAKLGTLTLESFNRSRVGWRGHRLVSWEVATRKVGKPAKQEQDRRDAQVIARRNAGATSKRGPSRTPWTLSGRSLTRVIARHFEQGKGEALQASWVAIQSVLAMHDHDQVVTFDDGTVVTVLDGSMVHDAKHDRAYPVGEWSKRYALANVA